MRCWHAPGLLAHVWHLHVWHLHVWHLHVGHLHVWHLHVWHLHIGHLHVGLLEVGLGRLACAGFKEKSASACITRTRTNNRAAKCRAMRQTCAGCAWESVSNSLPQLKSPFLPPANNHSEAPKREKNQKKSRKRSGDHAIAHHGAAQVELG
jgi:hypothetical protein